MEFFTADLHLGHKNAVLGFGRPFFNVDAMNATLIANWNQTVQESDTVYILGDFSFRYENSVELFLKQLSGQKVLVMGNHDFSWSKNIKLSDYFIDVHTAFTEIKLDGKRITLCHYPMLEWSGSRYGSYLIHGHVHDARDSRFEMLRQIPNAFNAAVEINAYRPVTLDQLITNNLNFYGIQRCEDLI